MRALGLKPSDFDNAEQALNAVGMKWLAKRRASDIPVFVAPPPDGEGVDARAELTALRPHLRMGLMARMRWVKEHGFNPCVVLGVPFGLTDRIYLAVFLAAVDEWRSSKVGGPFDLADGVELLKQALRDLCGVSNTASESNEAVVKSDVAESAEPAPVTEPEPISEAA